MILVQQNFTQKQPIFIVLMAFSFKTYQILVKRKSYNFGRGTNRIGQGIEFDYCCVHASYSLSELNIETIMINCNPETVSTDYDTSDKLYFEPLTRRCIRNN